MSESLSNSALALWWPDAELLDARPFRGGDLSPLEISVHRPAGSFSCVLKFSAGGRDALATEANALRLMERAGVTGPRVLALPSLLPNQVGVMALSQVPGEPLPWIGVTELRTANQTCQDMCRALDQLHGTTEVMMAADPQHLLPRRSLEDEFANLAASAWSSSPIHQAAVSAIAGNLTAGTLPLVFSNGDYNPLNVLVTDSGELTWIDFEHACFEDPLIGLAKFWFWADDRGWALGRESGLIERFLYRQGIAPRTFALRLALRGLQHLAQTSTAQRPELLLTEIEAATALLVG